MFLRFAHVGKISGIHIQTYVPITAHSTKIPKVRVSDNCEVTCNCLSSEITGERQKWAVIILRVLGAKWDPCLLPVFSILNHKKIIIILELSSS